MARTLRKVRPVNGNPKQERTQRVIWSSGARVYQDLHPLFGLDPMLYHEDGKLTGRQARIAAIYKS
jgi:hypothetical protein